MRRFTIGDDLMILGAVSIILIPFVLINGFLETQIGLITSICVFVIWIISAIVICIVDKKRVRRENLERQRLQQQEEEKKAHIESMRLPITRVLNPIEKDQEELEFVSKYLEDNGIKYFYHFTSIENVESIKVRGGLLSNNVIENNDIDVPIIGSNFATSIKEIENDIANYVHLCVNDDCIMLQECLLAGHKMVKLIIRADVALWENTLFLNMHSDGSYSIDKIPNLQKDRAELTEILVKDSIPVEYIQNIDCPEKVQPIIYFDDYLIIDARNFTIEEQLQVERAQVVDSTNGTSACFFMKGGGFSYIPMSPRSKLYSGDAIDMKTARIITLSKKESYYSKYGIPRNIDEVETIIRIE